MKGNFARFMKDDSGVSNVVAAVLSFALLVTIMGVVRMEFVPVWQSEREWDHMEQVQSEFKALKAEGERQISNHSRASAVTNPVTMGSSSAFPVLTGAGIPGKLHFTPGAHQANLSASELLIFQQDTKSHFGIDENWTEVPSQQTIEDIVLVQHLRIRVDDPGSLHGPPHGQVKGHVTLTVTDAVGAYAGDIRVYVESHQSGYNINTRVRNADMTTLYDQGHSHFQHSTPAHYWVDALSPENQFRMVLASAKAPLTFNWEEDELSGQYTVSYLQQAEGGVVQVGGSGVLEVDWERSHRNGILTFESGNRNFMDQRLHFEHGAVFLEQVDGTVMLSSPPFTASKVGDQTRISFSAIGLHGNHQNAGTTGTIPVSLQATQQTSITGSAPDFSWEYPTAFPKIWESFWRERLEAAGLTEADGHFTIDVNESLARLEVFGAHPDPNKHDISLEIRHGTLKVVINP